MPQRTEDGSFTFFSEAFGETFHSRLGARAEAFEKFAQVTRLALLARQFAEPAAPPIRLLDVCYGLGYNTAAALETLWAENPDCRVEAIALELDPTVPQAAIAPDLLTAWSPPVQNVLRAIAQTCEFQDSRLSARLLIGDARQTIQHVATQGFQADAIFFDPFSPRRCPQLWTVEFFSQVAKCLSPTGILATYSRSASVRAAMRTAGLHLGNIPLPAGAARRPHEWSQGTVAAWLPDGLPPLSPMEEEHLHTRAAVPYRDPNLNDSAAAILTRHYQEQQQAPLESTTSWRRRWKID
ncbi:tRNA (5-methylaminomethyl-2-thiouridine)(34)-methyltransferase MnmD [Leptolyngbya sp. O-77]|uniref:tRNA (5-methylaminomethyl-2-thiouridine)(34)-methyltransferase MnmD n=1 Tax=Leptolyngbya sp. O-77 TaxID=1080068 RepID=UPI00074D3A1B|nr:MnmC family methyltransferase [Leptolyngbya sp. O-77]BAU41467.1 tRNA 5-methylaminomethyl-2-thiouridine biosynthesis bifunctional protein MnmC [Leptolyngbya sp. O-77]